MFTTSSMEGVMYIAAIIGCWLVYFIWGWPSRVKKSIKDKPNGGGVAMGRWFIVVPVIAFFTIYFIYFTNFYLDNLSFETFLTDTETPFQSLLIIAAILFAIRFVPPTAYSAFWPVTNWDTGNYSMGISQELKIERDTLWPICTTVHNTGITSWDNYRVTLDFESGFEAKLEDDSIPSSHNWAWKSSNLKIMDNPCKVQAQATNALVVGENLIIRFLIKAHNVGRFPVNVNVGVRGRPGDTNVKLFLNVIEKCLKNET